MKHIKQWAIATIIGLAAQTTLAAGAKNANANKAKVNKTQVSKAQKTADNVKPVDDIVAVVDNGVITRREFEGAVAVAHSRLPKGTPFTADMQKQVLLELVNQSLLLQAAQRAGISVSDADIDDELQKIAASKNMTVAQAYQQIAKEGVDKAVFRHIIAEGMMAKKVEQSEVMSKGQVTEEEIDSAIARAKQAGQPLPPPVTAYTYHAQHILIKNDTEASRKLIREIAEQARGGANFEQLARQYSQDASAANGGDLGWLSDGETVPQFEATMKALKPGEVSQPVRTQFGWHIIKLVEIKSNDSPEQKQRNGMRAVLSEEKRAAVLNNLLQQLRQQAFIQVRL